MNKSEKPGSLGVSQKQEGKDQGFKVKTVNLETPSEEVQKILLEDRMVSVDLQFSDTEKLSLQNLEIEKETENFHYWGNASDPNLLLQLNTFLKNVGENSESTISEISDLFVRISKGLAKDFNTEFVWIESRAILPNNYFDTPRWHTDAKFYNPLTAYKLVVAIKGAQTRFGITTDQAKFVQLSIDENKEKHGSEEDIRIRKELDDIVEEIHSPDKKNAAIYLVSGDDAIIHSEPQINEARLFIAIVPGSEEEIEGWKNRMEQKRLRKKLKEQEVRE